MGADKYPNFPTQLSDPGQGHYATTQTDAAAEEAIYFRSLCVTAAGTLKFRSLNDEDVSYAAVAVGQVIPVRGKFVFDTGTTATVVAWY